MNFLLFYYHLLLILYENETCFDRISIILNDFSFLDLVFGCIFGFGVKIRCQIDNSSSGSKVMNITSI